MPKFNAIPNKVSEWRQYYNSRQLDKLDKKGDIDFWTKKQNTTKNITEIVGYKKVINLIAAIVDLYYENNDYYQESDLEIKLLKELLKHGEEYNTDLREKCCSLLCCIYRIRAAQTKDQEKIDNLLQAVKYSEKKQFDLDYHVQYRCQIYLELGKIYLEMAREALEERKHEDANDWYKKAKYCSLFAKTNLEEHYKYQVPASDSNKNFLELNRNLDKFMHQFTQILLKEDNLPSEAMEVDTKPARNPNPSKNLTPKNRWISQFEEESAKFQREDNNNQSDSMDYSPN